MNILDRKIFNVLKFQVLTFFWCLCIKKIKKIFLMKMYDTSQKPCTLMLRSSKGIVFDTPQLHFTVTVLFKGQRLS